MVETEHPVWDQASRYAAKLGGGAFCEWRLRRRAPQRRFRRWADTRTVPFPGEPDRTCDTVAEMVHADGTEPPLLVVFEFKPVFTLAAYPQVTRYALTLYDELRHDGALSDRYPVSGCLMFLTGEEAPQEWEMRPLDCKRLSVGGEFVASVVSGEKLSRLYADIRAGRAPLSALCWASLMRGGDDPGAVVKWRRLALQEPDARRRADYASLVILFAERLGRQELWKRGLEGWSVKESVVLNEWIREAEARGEERGERRGEERGERRGEERGERRGEERGERRGRTQTLRAAVICVLCSRFPGSLPEEIQQRLESQTDTVLLEGWLAKAGVAVSPTAWLDAIR